MALNLNEPLVSIIIVNWNYGRFIQEALVSVKNQTHKNLQCIIVDNASTDNSLAVIRREIKGDGRFKLIAHSENLGLLGGALLGLDHAAGEFVAFLDSDDYYFPDFVSLHLQAHMAAYQPTAFTSSAVVTVDEQGRMIGGNYQLGIKPGDKRFTSNLPEDSPYRLQRVSIDTYKSLAKATIYGSQKIDYWFWSPGSANLIRRQVLELLRPPKGAKVPIGGMDAYFLLAMHALTGTTLIGLPLSGYRLHGANDFLTSPRIQNQRIGRRETDMRNTRTKKHAIMNVANKAEPLIAQYSFLYFNLLYLITRRGNAIDTNAYDSHLIKYPPVFADPELQNALARNLGFMIRIFGLPTVLFQLRRIMGTFYLARILWLAWQSNHLKMPAAATSSDNPVL